MTAGDHVKFGFPMAGALTILLWGLERFKDGYVAANQLDAMYDTVKWGLDYVLDAWDPFTQQLVVQVCFHLHALIQKFKRLFTTSDLLPCIYYKHRFTTSVFFGGRCRKARLGVRSYTKFQNTSLRHLSFLAERCRKVRLTIKNKNKNCARVQESEAVTPNSRHRFTTPFCCGARVPEREF